MDSSCRRSFYMDRVVGLLLSHNFSVLVGAASNCVLPAFALCDGQVSQCNAILKHSSCEPVDQKMLLMQGVVKALFDCGMLPTVLSGSSVGSISAPPCLLLITVRFMMQHDCLNFAVVERADNAVCPACAVCAIIATRDDNELKDTFKDMSSVDLSFFSNSSIAQVPMPAHDPLVSKDDGQISPAQRSVSHCLRISGHCMLRHSSVGTVFCVIPLCELCADAHTCLVACAVV